MARLSGRELAELGRPYRFKKGHKPPKRRARHEGGRRRKGGRRRDARGRFV
jgi:hypothetical protein